jgi:predicted  nucleic acid-binding Zn-ribbon protein
LPKPISRKTIPWRPSRTEFRAERDAAVAELDTVRKAAGTALADAQKFRTELETLRSERKQVRTRIEKLLGKIDTLSA